ncbi:NEL-type E3 ubiquitin ligase domain-containing protein [Bradyrhizobium sp. Leo170]|uniref:NEL-type E3 ubiquitin ligase domain-containing protein n=1 Tax=Bradyrhizobium sp. Leo170 TaxID=1571199 RepID=UPI001FDEEA5A|nr:NEL-type E3 ubiquitin ligase domain-containing protein [Bradyrhizobium sp. Leo170]
MTSLPETLLTQLGSGRLVDLDDNPLPARVRTNLTAATKAEGYAGPNVFFSDPDETAQDRARPLAEAVADWLDEPDAAAIWRSFADEPGAEEYSRFLDRLRDTVNYDAFRQAVAEDLRQAPGRPTLREQYFQAAVAANESCEDRIKLNWNGMHTARVNADVLGGAYNEHLDKLLQQGRFMFRVVALEGIAREKVTSLPLVDEIEVYLAYQAKLREPLELGHIAPDMRFVGVSYVTEDDLAAAKTSVRNQEAAEFADFLATRWQPWDTLVSRIAPEAYTAMEGRMGEELESRLAQRLADHQPTSDAEPPLRARIRNEIVREIKGELMQKVLAEHGLERLLLPDNSATG